MRLRDGSEHTELATGWNCREGRLTAPAVAEKALCRTDALMSVGELCACDHDQAVDQVTATVDADLTGQ